MTSIVGILCSDGVVVGADSAITTTMGNTNLFEQTNYQKIRILGGRVIAAFAGDGDCHHRVCANVEAWLQDVQDTNVDEMAFAVTLHSLCVAALSNTGKMPTEFNYDVMFAFVSQTGPTLCHFKATENFQPHFVTKDGLWFATMGSGFLYTHPFLGFLRNVLWNDSLPKVAGGTFTAFWALRHACHISAGGISEPLNIATLTRNDGGAPLIRELSRSDLDQHADNFEGVTQHLRDYRDKMLGETTSLPKVPKPPND